MNRHVCPVCLIQFSKKVYKKTHAVYCSQNCAYKGRTLGTSKRVITTPYNCKRKKPRTCLICQNEYIYRNKTQKYCSRRCFEISHKETMLGNNNPAYKNGSSYLKRGWRGNDWETIRLEIYKRDNYTCRDCGEKCVGKMNYKKNSNKIIQCHHIEKYETNHNNKESNLVTLCLKCHLKRHN